MAAARVQSGRRPRRRGRTARNSEGCDDDDEQLSRPLSLTQSLLFMELDAGGPGVVPGLQAHPIVLISVRLSYASAREPVPSGLPLDVKQEGAFLS